MARKDSLRVLLITPNDILSELIERLFVEVKPYQSKIKRKKNVSSALSEIQSGEYKICFIDDKFRDENLLLSLKEILLFTCRTPLIFIVNEHDGKIQAEILQTNVIDFSLKKILDANLLKRKIDLVVKTDEKFFEAVENELLYEHANDLIYVHDLDGNFLSINASTERIMGYSQKEVLKLNIKQVIAPESIEYSYEMLTAKIEGQGQTIYETNCIAKDGRRVVLEVNSNPIYKNGVLVAVQGIARDITERKQSEYFMRLNETKLKDLFDNAPIGYHELDAHGRIVRVNQSELEMLGYLEDEMLGHFVWEFIAEKKSRELILNKLNEEKLLTPHEQTFLKKDGTFISVLVNDKLIKNESGIVTGILTTVHNISEQKQFEEALKNSERQYRLMGEGIMHQVWTAKPDGHLDYVNQRTTEYFGKTYKKMIGDGWKNVVHPEDLEGCVEKWMHSLSTGDDYIVEFRLRRHDGEYFWFQARAAAGRDAKGNIIKWFGTNTDIDDRKGAEAKLSYFAGHDTLTNLPNRARFMNFLERAVKRSEYDSNFQFSVLFLDLDRFKVINDSLGHSVGDQLLIEIAKRLEECVRPTDVVARLGGDEFTILLTRIGKSLDSINVANRILEEVSKPFKIENYEVFTSASIGIVASDKMQRKPGEVLRDADTAMYRAKAAGKSRYEIFDDEMHVRNMNLMRMETDLRRAVERNEFRVFYQPIIELENGEILEFEALIRWQHPQYGLVAPGDFIPIAEETGLIVSIGKWVLEEACRQTVKWQSRFKNHKELGISVNLSAKQLLHPNITAHIKETLNYTSINPKCLKLEVTESMVMENGEKSLAVIKEFHTLGTSISTDDFGTGYSSLSYLHNFPFNRLKIDRSFIGKIETDLKCEAIVRTILILGQNLEIGTIAEGIETEHQLWQLRSLGCRLGQGFFFSKPVDAETAETLLMEGIGKDISALETPFKY